MAVIPVPIARDETGPTVNAAQAAAVFAYLGCAGEESPTAINVPVPLRSDGDAEELFAGGPLVELGRAAPGYSRQAGVAVRVEAAEPGSYGDVDLTDFTGSAVPAAAPDHAPWNDHELRIEFDTGGTVGVPGLYYRVGLDGEKTGGAPRSFLGGRRPLGTRDTIVVGEANARITLYPPPAQVAALISLVTELLTDRALHYAMGTTVHLAPDTLSDDGFTAVPTTADGCIAAVNSVRVGDLAHAASLIAHANSDLTRYADCPPVATSVGEAIVLAGYLKARGTAHNNALTNAASAPIHGSADATHDIVAPTPTPGTVASGDVIRVPLRAPRFDAAGLAAAFEKLSQYTAIRFQGVAVKGAVDATMWPALVAGIDLLRERLGPVSLVCEMRLRDEGETELAYRTSLEENMAGLEDADIYRCANLIRYDPATLPQLRYYARRTQLVPFVARLQAVDYGTSPGLVEKLARAPGTTPSVFGGPLAGALIREDGALVGHDERSTPGLHDAGFGVLTSYKERPATEAYVFRPKTAAPAGNTAPHITQRRVSSAAELIIGNELINLIESGPTLHEPGRTTLRRDVCDRIDGRMNDRLRSELAGRIDTVVFAVDREAEIDLQDTVIRWNTSLKTGGFVWQLPGTIRINQRQA